MSRAFRFLVIALVAIALGGSPSVYGGHASYDDFPWSEERMVLVIAHVIECGNRHLNEDNIGGNAWASLEPLATLAGNLDPSSKRALKVTFYQGVGTMHIFELPPKGSLIMAVVQEDKFIISDSCTFMPDDSPLVVLEGLGDKRILETIRRLRKVRLEPPTTRPAWPPP